MMRFTIPCLHHCPEMLLQMLCTASRMRASHAGMWLMQRQEEERGRKAREEKDKHLYTVIKAARAQDLQEQIGNTLFWDLVDFEQVRLAKGPDPAYFS